MRRLCSECGAPLSEKAPRAKTCGTKCRTARSRRLRQQKAEAGAAGALSEHQKIVQEITRGERDDVARRLVQDELRPVVREAITEDVLRGIAELIAMTPEVVAAIREDLLSDDVNVRQKAYALVAKYTFGHPAIVRPPEETDGKELHVHFALPRPEDDVAPVEDVPEAEVVEETQPCDRCGGDFPLSEFVAGSARCKTCFEAQKEEARRLFDKADE